MIDKGPSFSSFVLGTPTITLNKLKEMKIIGHGQILLHYGLSNGYEDHLLPLRSRVLPQIKSLNGEMDDLLCNILQQSIETTTLDNLGAYQTCHLLWTQVKKLYTNDIQHLYWVIFLIDSLNQPRMKLPSFVGR